MRTYLLLIAILCCSLNVFAQDKPKIGLLMDDHLIPRWAKDSTEFCNAVRSLGGEPLVAEGENDPAIQLKRAGELITKGAKVLVVIPTDAVQAGKIVEMAHARGVLVIAYDRMIVHPKLDFYVSFDNQEVGRLQAQYILDHVPNGNIMLLNGPKADFNSSLFREGQMEILNPAISSGRYRVVLDKSLSEWTPLAAFMELNEYFGDGQVHVDAVLATNDAIAEGTYDAMEAFYTEKKSLITGQDGEKKALERIKNGHQAMTVMKPIDRLAQETAKLCMSLVSERPMPQNVTTVRILGSQVKSLQIKPFVVDAKNVKGIEGH